jgi:hypothetical protein
MSVGAQVRRRRRFQLCLVAVLVQRVVQARSRTAATRRQHPGHAAAAAPWVGRLSVQPERLGLVAPAGPGRR